MKEKINHFDILYIAIGVPWIFLMIMSSQLFSTLKIGLLVILLFIAVCEMLLTKSTISKEVFIIGTVFILYFSLSLGYGVLKGYDFSIKNEFPLIQYYIITPICVIVLAKVFSMKNYRVEFVWKLLRYITMLLTVLDVISIILYRNGIFIKLLGFIKYSSNNMANNVLELRVTNETSMMFLLPIYIFLLINSKKNRKMHVIIVLFGIVYSLLSGRKMLEIVVFLTILVSIVYRIKNNKINLKKFLMYIIIACMLVGILGKTLNFVFNSLNIDNIFIRVKDTLFRGFSSEAIGVTKRATNAKALMEMFLESPIIGNGLNSYDINSIANTTDKWSYEIFYNALLAQSGIVGVTILVIAIIGIINKLYINYKRNNDLIYYAIMIGFISFLICSASNPMIYFAWPWIIAMIYSIKEVKNEKEMNK